MALKNSDLLLNLSDALSSNLSIQSSTSGSKSGSSFSFRSLLCFLAFLQDDSRIHLLFHSICIIAGDG